MAVVASEGWAVPPKALGAQAWLRLKLAVAAAVLAVGGFASGGQPAMAVSCPTVQNTPRFTIAYGTVTVAGAQAAAGTVVEARNPRGEAVGCFQVTQAGSYGAMYVYGEDTSVTPNIPGMRSGESVSFYIGGQTAGVSPALVWQDDRELHQIDLAISIVRSMVFVQEPTRGSHGFSLGPQPMVALQEGGAVAVSDNSTVVTLRIKTGSGTPGALLICTDDTDPARPGIQKTLASGRATFSGCKIDLKGDGYILEAVASGIGTGETSAFSVVWAGDANGDCQVDILDFSVLVKSFLRPPSDPAFDRRADINLDNQVDIQDFSLLKSMFGTRCPALTLLPASGGGGASVTVSGTAFVANRDVNITLDGATLATTTTDSAGGFTSTITIPVGTTVGSHVVKASQVSGRVVAAKILTVQ